jgi:solute carrier family 35 protein E3
VLQGFIILSCLIAVSVNFSTFLVIGTTSPVTYQVLGHLKTCLVLSFGYTLLHDPFTARNILGILVAIFGMALYSVFSVREGKKKSAGDALPVSQVRTAVIDQPSQFTPIYQAITYFAGGALLRFGRSEFSHPWAGLIMFVVTADA